MENHAEIKDKCDDLECRLEQLASDIRDLPFNYKITERYSHIDEELFNVYEWYEKHREMLKQYQEERVKYIETLKQLDTFTKNLNNEIQNTKSQAFFRARHGGSYSQLPGIQHP